MSLKGWARHGILNTMEHALTRIADAATSLVLLWALSPEAFSKISLAQAIIAPLLFFFISPETVIYRDFRVWKEMGAAEVSRRIHAFRLFAWGKAQFAIVLCAGLAFLPGGSDPYTRFCSLVFAFSLALAPQISGPDREFLRVDLKLSELNLLSLYQKFSLLAGTVFVAKTQGARIDLLALVAAFSAVTTALLARVQVVRILGAPPRGSAHVVPVLRESFQSFSAWQHLTGVILGWVQTMDLFFLGVFRFPAREVGLYAAVLKLANFTYALPMALCNLFSIWFARQKKSLSEGMILWKLVGLIFVIALVQTAVLLGIFPWIVNKISHGRWTPSEMETMGHWFVWIVSGGVLMSASFLLSAWGAAYGSISRLFWRVYLPWGVLSAAMYTGAIIWKGFDGAAIANAPVAILYVVLLVAVMLRREGREE